LPFNTMGLPLTPLVRTCLTYVSSSKAVDFLSNLETADQKLLAGLDQSLRRNGFLDPSNVLEVGQKLLILLIP
jgi:antitoxin component of RelBE/YafQ-DinJ toxin-antitoxin module